MLKRVKYTRRGRLPKIISPIKTHRFVTFCLWGIEICTIRLQRTLIEWTVFVRNTFEFRTPHVKSTIARYKTINYHYSTCVDGNIIILYFNVKKKIALNYYYYYCFWRIKTKKRRTPDALTTRDETNPANT